MHQSRSLSQRLVPTTLCVFLRRRLLISSSRLISKWCTAGNEVRKELRLGPQINLSDMSDKPPPQRTSQCVADWLRGYIRTHDLRPGDRLPSEHRLVKVTGVGRSSVREGMHLLAGQGLIEAHAGKGYYVVHAPLRAKPARRTSAIELRELTEARLLLECECAALAALRATPEETASIDAFLDHMEAQVSSSPSIYLDSIKLHLMIGEAAHNRALSEMLKVILPRLAALGAETAAEIPNHAQVDVALHRDLWKSIRSRDPERARAAMATHIRYAESIYLMPHEFETLRSTPDRSGESVRTALSRARSRRRSK